MRVLGIAVRVETSGRPIARGALIDDVTNPPGIVDQFELPGDDVEFAQQLVDLSKAVSSRIEALKPERVVIRRADFPPQGSRGEGPKLRLLAEGAITAAARERIPASHLATGHEIGLWDGRGKAGTESAAKAVVLGKGLPLKWVDAVAAALGALGLP